MKEYNLNDTNIIQLDPEKTPVALILKICMSGMGTMKQ